MQVVQSTFSWLPLTQHWLGVQTSNLPARIESAVVATRTDDESHPWPSLEVVRLGSYQPGRLSRVLCRWLRRRLLERAIQRTGASLVHSHFGDQGWEDLFAVQRSGCAHVVTFYGYDVGRLPKSALWRDRYDRLFTAVDCVLCEGPFMASTIATLGCPPAKIRVHHLGIETDRIPFQPRRWRQGETLRVLIAASFVEKKGIPDGLRALARLESVALEITVIGDSNGTRAAKAEKKTILRTLADQGLGAKTRFLGYQSHQAFHRAAASHHLFLQPSVTARDGDCEGGAPVSLIEMAASGMPVVATAHCDIPEVVLHARTGWLAPERDVGGLVAALHRWIDRPESWESLLLAGRRHVESEFDAARQGERLAMVYEEVVERTVPSATSRART